MSRAPQIAFAMIAALTAGCSDDRRPPPVVHDDAERPRRVPLERKHNRVVSNPPHGINNDAVGPYKLGEALASVLAGVPAGGIEVLDIPGVVRTSVVSVEDGQMLLGADQLSITFVGILAPQVALVEKIEVGSTRDALVQTLGQPLRPPTHATDPRLVTVAKLPGVRFVVDRDRVAAVLVSARRAEAIAPVSAKLPACQLIYAEAAALAFDAALGGTPSALECLTANEVVATVDDSIVVIATGDKPRRLYSQRVPGLVFAGAAHDTNRDEVVAITTRRTDQELVYSLVTARWEAGRITKTLDEPIYRVTDQGAGWLGAKLADLDLVIDVEARADTLVATGVLLGHGEAMGYRLVAPLAPITVARRKRSSPEATGSGGVGGDSASVQPLADAAPPIDAAPP